MQLSYSQYHRAALAGLDYDFHVGEQTRNYLNPLLSQISKLTVTTAAAGLWLVTATDNTTGEVTSLSWTSAGTDAATTYAELIAAWNSTPAARQVAVASLNTVAQLEFNKPGRIYTMAVTPAGAGAAAWALATAAGGFNLELGAWAVRVATAGAGIPATDEDAITLAAIPDSFATIADVVGVVRRALHHTQSDLTSNLGYDTYRPGTDCPIKRRGGIWVPCAVACRPGDAVEIHNTSGSYRNGWTTTGGAGLVVPWAEFLTVGAAGGLVAIGLSKE